MDPAEAHHRELPDDEVASLDGWVPDPEESAPDRPVAVGGRPDDEVASLDGWLSGQEASAPDRPAPDGDQPELRPSSAPDAVGITPAQHAVLAERHAVAVPVPGEDLLAAVGTSAGPAPTVGPGRSALRDLLEASMRRATGGRSSSWRADVAHALRALPLLNRAPLAVLRPDGHVDVLPVLARGDADQAHGDLAIGWGNEPVTVVETATGGYAAVQPDAARGPVAAPETQQAPVPPETLGAGQLSTLRRVGVHAVAVTPAAPSAHGRLADALVVAYRNATGRAGEGHPLRDDPSPDDAARLHRMIDTLAGIRPGRPAVELAALALQGWPKAVERPIAGQVRGRWHAPVALGVVTRDGRQVRVGPWGDGEPVWVVETPGGYLATAPGPAALPTDRPRHDTGPAGPAPAYITDEGRGRLLVRNRELGARLMEQLQAVGRVREEPGVLHLFVSATRDGEVELDGRPVPDDDLVQAVTAGDRWRSGRVDTLRLVACHGAHRLAPMLRDRLGIAVEAATELAWVDRQGLIASAGGRLHGETPLPHGSLSGLVRFEPGREPVQLPAPPGFEPRVRSIFAPVHFAEPDQVRTSRPAFRVEPGPAGVRPQPEEEPVEEEPRHRGTVYSADLIPTPEEAAALVPGAPFATATAATGTTDPARLPTDTRVMTIIEEASLPGPGGGDVAVEPGRLYLVVSATADPMDPDMVRVVLRQVV
ncbi:MAG TPA: hypothetical protein VD813_05745 [Pseudonocardia sp.]|nr:hypothetical protein [Pseudonocardia sp.]